MIHRLTFAISILCVQLCAAQKPALDETALYREQVFAVTEVLFHDVVNPPAAARYYAYCTLASLIAVSPEHPESRLPRNLLSRFELGEVSRVEINPSFAAMYTLLETAKNLVPSGESLLEKQLQLTKTFLHAGEKKKRIEASKVYAERISRQVVTAAKQDGYLKLSALTRYSPKDTDAMWAPTPPQYMSAVEPHWSSISTFFLDSASQFRPLPPVAFNTDTTSQFFSLSQEVYRITQSLTPEQRHIAEYWDCNPFATYYSGHMTIAIKKISPAGHWMNITGLACHKAKVSFAKTVQVHALVAMGMHDGFVSCWESKYHSERVRPKTVINKLLDSQWEPILETPPFPEYSSGHSVISTIAAEILTYFIGDQVPFTDTTETIFGLPERNFVSFRAAAQEASLSRLYGGIHFRDAIVNGQLQGKSIATYMLEKIRMSH